MPRFWQIYIKQLIIFIIGTTIVAAAFWSNDFTVTRIALNIIQSFFFAFFWAATQIKFESWLDKRKPMQPKVEPDKKPVWPPVVDRK